MGHIYISLGLGDYEHAFDDFTANRNSQVKQVLLQGSRRLSCRLTNGIILETYEMKLSIKKLLLKTRISLGTKQIYNFHKLLIAVYVL